MLWMKIVYLNTLFVCTRGDTYYTHYLHDRMPLSDREKMYDVAKELIKDTNLKLRQIAEIRDRYSSTEAFAIGMIMGNIREKYRRMLETYRELRDKDNGRSIFVPTSVFDLHLIHYIMSMEHIHFLEHSIDKLIHVLEVIRSKVLNPDPRYTTTVAKKAKRSRDESAYAVLMRYKEEELKKTNRESRLQRRLGVTGHTPRKRFAQQWPVEGSWILGQYGDMDIYAH